eukprot:CAMPEP_0174259512 /NCGR_PEP_ID=MMETSP0439-20130205/8327_1 /TAXON_ID=0 /ORGANISM="Stereomyxa ramosa, Strain Chinc5" /LENGTH=113 /DNA_ID=CAMNT_0015343421 /DNA_START=285 /DNA_END=623 /DNA_ORIENTATION=-
MAAFDKSEKLLENYMLDVTSLASSTLSSESTIKEDEWRILDCLLEVGLEKMTEKIKNIEETNNTETMNEYSRWYELYHDVIKGFGIATWRPEEMMHRAEKQKQLSEMLKNGTW